MPTTSSKKQAKLDDEVSDVSADVDVRAKAQASKKEPKAAKDGSKSSSTGRKHGKKAEAAAAADDAQDPSAAGSDQAEDGGRSAKAGTKRKHADTDKPEIATAADEADETGSDEQSEGEAAAGKGAEAGAEPEQQQKSAAGQGSEGAIGSLPDNAIEEGKVSFMFRPRVTSPGSDVDVSSVDDVQRLYLLLEPHQPPGGKCRLLVVPKKTLPDTKKHERFFAFVEAVGGSVSELTGGLGEHTYTTKTRGERLQPAAQPAGEGTYVIAKGGSKKSIHLGFKLSSPSEPGEVQDMLGIQEEGSFVISAKNPERKGQGPNVPSAGPDPDYSSEQREEFGDRAWIGVEDRSLLDVAGTELLLVGAKDKPIETGELGEAGKLLEEVAA